MDTYLNALLTGPRLSADEELALAEDARKGSAEARSELVVSGLRSVALQALMLGARGDQLLDAVQAGSIALIRAVDRFDPSRGVRLATYSWPWVRGAILRELRADRAPEEVPSSEQTDSGWEVIDGLPPEQAQVLDLRFGLSGNESALSRDAVAARLSLSVARVRRIEAEAMRQVRSGLASIDPRALSTSAPIPHSSIGRAFDC